MKYASSCLKRRDALVSSSDVLRFLRDKVALSLPQGFDDWKEYVFGGRVQVYSDDGRLYFFSHLLSLRMDFMVHGALLKAGLNIPCRVMGDIAESEGKGLGCVPISALREYGELHRNEILEWVKIGKDNCGYISNEAFRVSAIGGET